MSFEVGTHGSQITLAWRQKVAAYWAISWPAFVASVFMWTTVFGNVSTDRLLEQAIKTAFAGFVVFFGVQSLLTRRLVRKKFRTFRIQVIRDDRGPTSQLSMLESVRIWLWIVVPQISFTFAVLAISALIGAPGLASLALLLQFVIVGPYAVDLALRVTHRGFKLQAYGYRYI